MILAIFALTKNGIRLAKGLSRKMGGAYLFVNRKDFRDDVKFAFKKYDGLIFIMAAGIVVRVIAPLLKGKTEDPAVVVIDEKGNYAISLLSGHLGGANKLAEDIAKIIGAKPVITTATDVNNLPCIEDIAEKFHLAIEDVKKIKVVNSAIVNGRTVVIVDENIKRLSAIKKFAKKGFRYYKSVSQVRKNKIDVLVLITNKGQGQEKEAGETMILRPKDLVIGIGCDRGVSLKEVEDAYFGVLKKQDVSPLCVRNLASIDVKKDEKGLLRFAKKHNLKINFYSKDELAKMPLPSGFSPFVMGKVGVGGVCEPAALKSAGTKRIWVKKNKIGRVTIAIAQAPFAL